MELYLRSVTCLQGMGRDNSIVTFPPLWKGNWKKLTLIEHSQLTTKKGILKSQYSLILSRNPYFLSNLDVHFRSHKSLRSSRLFIQYSPRANSSASRPIPKTLNGTLCDMEHVLDQGVLYFQTSHGFIAHALSVFSFAPMRKIRHSMRRCSWNLKVPKSITCR